MYIVKVKFLSMRLKKISLLKHFSLFPSHFCFFLSMFYIHLTFLLSCHQILLKNRLYYSVHGYDTILHTPLLYSLSVDTPLKTDEMGIILNILLWNTSFLDKSKYQKFICFLFFPFKIFKVEENFDLYSKQKFSYCSSYEFEYNCAYYKNIIDWQIPKEYSKF